MILRNRSRYIFWIMFRSKSTWVIITYFLLTYLPSNISIIDCKKKYGIARTFDCRRPVKSRGRLAVDDCINIAIQILLYKKHSRVLTLFHISSRPLLVSPKETFHGGIPYEQFVGPHDIFFHHGRRAGLLLTHSWKSRLWYDAWRV